MQTKKLPALIEYYELDERVNINNYKVAANMVEFDSELFNDWIDYEGTKQLEDEITYYQEIAECHLVDKEISDYYRNTWVEKKLYADVRNLRRKLAIPISTGTLCMITLAIRSDFNHIRNRREGNIYTTERWEYLKFHKALNDILHANINASSIVINSGSKEIIKVQFPRYIAEQIVSKRNAAGISVQQSILSEYHYNEQFQTYYESKPKDNKKWFEHSRQYVIKRLNEVLLNYDLPKTSRHLAIDQILAIAGVEFHKVFRGGTYFYGKNRDNISRKIKRLMN